MPEPTTTTTAAPAAPPPSAATEAKPADTTTAPAGDAKPSGDTAAPKPTRAELRAKAIADMKKALDADKAETKPTDGETKQPADETKPPAAETKKTEERPASQLAEITRQHKKLLDEKAAHEKATAADKATIAARKSDLELVDKLKAGDYVAALEALDPQWYDKASKQYVAKMKPGDPAVVAEQLREEIRKQRAEIEELKNPKPKPLTKEEVEAQEAQAAEGYDVMRTHSDKIVAADARFVELKKEKPEEIHGEVKTLIERYWKDAGSRSDTSLEQFHAWIERACVSLEAALRAQKELTAQEDAGTVETATGQPSAKSGSDNPHQIKPRGPDSLTASLGESVPVGQRKLTREERLAAAKAQIRAAGTA